MRIPCSWLLVCLLSAILAGCVLIPREPGIGKVVPWSKLRGWQEDRVAASWPALLHGCAKLEASPPWHAICAAASGLDNPTDRQARAFYEKWFEPRRVYGSDGGREGLITGYYEPLLAGSRTRSERFRFPLYGRPPDLLTVDLGGLYPELKGRRLRGKLVGRKVMPYYSRQQLEASPQLLAGSELLWVTDPVGLFFLHIQGSGRVQLPDGTLLAVGYADQNGHPYRSIGRELIERGILSRDEVNLFSIRDWLRRNPQQAGALMHSNPSYVFFTLRQGPAAGPIGSLNVPLTPERSIAVDPSVIPLGTPVWLETTLPDGSEQAYRRLALAQDTGGAIKGQVRADLFWGRGDRAERMAGLMKQTGRLTVLIPKAGTHVR